MPLINAAAIPTERRAALKKVCETKGPIILGDRYPKDADGRPKATLTQTEAQQVMEAVTREFWRQLLQQVAVEEAAEAARLQAVAATAADPFGA